MSPNFPSSLYLPQYPLFFSPPFISMSLSFSINCRTSGDSVWLLLLQRNKKQESESNATEMTANVSMLTQCYSAPTLFSTFSILVHCVSISRAKHKMPAGEMGMWWISVLVCHKEKYCTHSNGDVMSNNELIQSFTCFFVFLGAEFFLCWCESFGTENKIDWIKLSESKVRIFFPCTIIKIFVFF